MIRKFQFKLLKKVFHYNFIKRNNAIYHRFS